MNVILNITTTPTALPAGVIAGLLALSITDPSGQSVVDANGQPIATQQVSGTTATFANVGAGNYLASAVRLDTNGTPIGAPVTQAFTVTAAAPAPGTSTAPASVSGTAASTAGPTFDAPQSITVTLG